MMTRLCVLSAWIVVSFSYPGFGQEGEIFQISKHAYEDKVKAIWLAQITAVQIGWDFESKPASVVWIDSYSEDRLNKIRENGGGPLDDDWYYELTALNGFEKYGNGMTVEQYGDQWMENNTGTWAAAYYTRQNLLKGIKGADCGNPRYNRCWFDITATNRCELFAMMSPAMLNLTAAMSRYYSHLYSYGEGTDGGVLLGTMVSLGFMEEDPGEIIRKSIHVLHPESPHRLMVEKILEMAYSGKDYKDCMQYINREWTIDRPGTATSLWNLGFAITSLYYGEGDFWKTLNIALSGADYFDGDCVAAEAAVVLAAIHGTKCIPEELITPLNNRIKGTQVGHEAVRPPVDMRISDLVKRTVQAGEKYMLAHGVRIENDSYMIPLEDLRTQELEFFRPEYLMQWWNPGWELDQVAFGIPGGGSRGTRGGTFIESDSVLATFPRNYMRGVKISSKLRLARDPVLRVEVAADPGRKWRLVIYLDNHRLFNEIIDGGPPLPESAGTDYPQPLFEYDKYPLARKWKTVELDLSEFKNREVIIRLFQENWVNNSHPGNAYWKNLKVF